MLQKIQKLLDSLPEDMRMVVIQKYSTGEPKSPRVKKIVKIIGGLKPEEKQELEVFLDDVLHRKEQTEDGESIDTE